MTHYKLKSTEKKLNTFIDKKTNTSAILIFLSN